MARDAAEQSRLLTLPKEYKVELPKDFKVPDGMEFSLNESDPQMANFKAFAQAKRLSQEDFSEGLALFAGVKLSEQQRYEAARNAEIAKLGASGPGRMDAINTWMKANGFTAMPAMLVTEAIVKEFEGLMAKLRGGGGGGHRPNGSDNGAADGKIAGFEKMSFAQQRHAQEQLRQQRNGR